MVLGSTRLALVRDVAFVKVKTGIEDGFPPLNLRKVLESLPGVDVYGQTCVSDAWQVCAVRIDEGNVDEIKDALSGYHYFIDLG